MKRRYITPMVRDTEWPFAWLGKVARTYNGRAATGAASCMPADPAATGAWALYILETPDHTDALNDLENFALPDLTLDAPIGTFWSTQTRNKLTSIGVDISGISSQSLFRDLVRRIGRTLNVNFDENAFDARA